MFIPLHDANSLKHIKVQYVTIGLILIDFVVWLVTGLTATQAFSDAVVVGLGYIPAVVFGYAALEPALRVIGDDVMDVGM